MNPCEGIFGGRMEHSSMGTRGLEFGIINMAQKQDTGSEQV